MRLREAVDDYLKLRNDDVELSRHTIRNETHTLNQMVDFLGAGFNAKRLEPLDIQRFMLHVGSKLAASSFNVRRAQVSGFLAWGYMAKRMEPALMSMVRRRTIIQRDMLILPPNEMMALLKAAPTRRDRGALALVCNFGCRQSEMLSLTPGAVDLAAGRLRVWVSKSKRDVRKPINSDFDAEHRDYMTWYTEHLMEFFDMPLTRKNKSSLFLYSSGTGRGNQTDGRPWRLRPERPWSGTGSLKMLKKLLDDLGYADEYRTGWHTLRRSAVRAYYESMKGILGRSHALGRAQALLNHKESSTTEIYLGLYGDSEGLDEDMMGKPFLTKLVSDEGVVDLAEYSRRRAENG